MLILILLIVKKTNETKYSSSSFQIENNSFYSVKNVKYGFFINTNSFKKFINGGKELNSNEISETGHQLKLIKAVEEADSNILYYAIEDLENGFRLDSNQDGHVYLHEGNDGDYQLWQLINVKENIFKFRNKKTQFYLTVEYDLIKTVKDDYEEDDQYWQLIN